MTAGLLKSSHTVDKLYKKSLAKDPSSPEHKAYIQFRNRYNSLKRYAKKAYYNNKIVQFKNDSSKLWKILNEVIGKSNNKSGISDIFVVNGKHVTNPNEIANHFCSYYTNVGHEFAAKIPSSKNSAMSYMKGNFVQSLFFEPVDEDEIKKILQSLKPKKSVGYDNISAHLLKQLSSEIALPISTIINSSLSSGIVPECMKLAKIVPIYKSKGDSQLFTNYRPISLLPVLSKLLEKVVHKRLYEYLIKYDILNKSQYGFRNSHSTTDAITELASHILQNYDKREFTLSVFLDLSKAFDTINHNTLLKKLHHYGIRGIALDWFKSYLVRKQFVKYKDYQSATQDLTCGVPQGSVLGPLLFILYTNDLPSCLSNSKSLLFADDTTIYLSGNCRKYMSSKMKADISELIEWFRANKLSLNINKTNFVLFKPKKLVIPDDSLDSDCTLSFGNEEISCLSHTKFLGMELDEYSEWSSHYKSLNSRLSRAIFSMNKVKNVLPTSCMKMLYYSLFHSHLTYGLHLWGPNIADKLRKKVFLKQKKIIRIMCNESFNAHTDDLFKRHEILKLEDLIDLEIQKLMFKHSKDMLPLPLMSLFPVSTTKYQTRQQWLPCVKKPNYEPLQKSFLTKGPKLWRSNTNDMKECKHLKSFANCLKKSKLLNY